MIIPLPLFPNWLQPVIHAMPFRGLIDVPLRIYTGNLSMIDAGIGILQQLFWIGAFIVIGRWFLSRGMCRLAVQGG
jgi:ABC-2 type transport system permease protein